MLSLQADARPIATRSARGTKPPRAPKPEKVKVPRASKVKGTKLVVTEGPLAGTVVPLDGAQVTIGQNGVRIDGSDIAQVPAGEGHEDVFQRSAVGGEIADLGAGLVELDNPFNTATNFVVQGGKLVVHDDRANGTGLTTNGYTDLPTALISDGASLAIQLGDQSVRAVAGVAPGGPWSRRGA